ncbi:DUF2933 domain-containing protein [Bacillus sp. FJAT-27445]|uniref:DUF2933 domain-containing protein n=1 Tax=Bacillus sp. FJAT-27445 TaxID=1679166 RepID=UPI0007434995|nr:DUF2933 domain-containing protein [Bacillus sp. FJAT-27445]
MNWLLLLMLLICPLMMIFMMKNHGSHGGCHQNKKMDLPKDIDSKIARLEQENDILRREINTLTSMVKKE